MADFNAMLSRAYGALGTSAVHTSAESGVQTPVLVEFDAGGGGAGLDGLVSADSPSITLPTAAVPGRVVRKGDRFELNGQAWLAREASQPLRDGEELHVQLKKAG